MVRAAAIASQPIGSFRVRLGVFDAVGCVSRWRDVRSHRYDRRRCPPARLRSPIPGTTASSPAVCRIPAGGRRSSSSAPSSKPGSRRSRCRAGPAASWSRSSKPGSTSTAPTSLRHACSVQELAEREGFVPDLYEQATHELNSLAPIGRSTCGLFGIGGNREHDREALGRLYDHLDPGGLLVLDHEMSYADAEGELDRGGSTNATRAVRGAGVASGIGWLRISVPLSDAGGRSARATSHDGGAGVDATRRPGPSGRDVPPRYDDVHGEPPRADA